MLLRFVTSRNPEYNNSVAFWNGIVVIMEKGLTGVVDVMFTGVSRNNKVIFAEPVEDSGARKVFSKGFSTSGSMCSTSAAFKDGEEIGTIYPGRLNLSLFSQDNVNIVSKGFKKPSLNGYFYIKAKGIDYTCVGVEDPSLFNAFSFQHNQQLIEMVKKYGFKAGTYYDVVTYDGSIHKAFVKEAFSWSSASAFFLDTPNDLFNLNLGSVHYKEA